MSNNEHNHESAGFLNTFGASCIPEVSHDRNMFRIRLRDLRTVLCFAATPVFALLALLSAFGNNEMAAICGGGTFALTGMVSMYLFMSLFHIGPWLRLFEDSTTS